MGEAGCLQNNLLVCGNIIVVNIRHYDHFLIMSEIMVVILR
jgi:hypothetical protein